MNVFLKLKIATYNIFDSISELKNLVYKTSQKKIFFENYKILSENVDDLILVIDTNQNLKFVEKTCQNFFSPNELIFFKRFVKRNYSAYFKQMFDDAIIKDIWTCPYVEFPIKAKNGRLIWVRLNVRITKIHNDLIITGRMKGINDQSNHFYRTNQSNIWFNIIQNSSNGVFVEDSNRRILFLNKAFLMCFDINDEPSSFNGKDSALFMERIKDSFVYPSLFTESIEQNIKQKNNVRSEVLKMKNGKTIERDYETILNPGGEYSHFWHYKDLTNSHDFNEKVKESEEKYRKIIENMQLGILEVDNSDTVTNVYNHFCQLTGYNKEDIIGKRANELFLKPEHRQTIKNNLSNREQGISSTFEIPLLKKDGTTAWLLVSGTPIFDNNNNSIGSIGIHYDITKRKQLELDLKQANEIANKVNENEKLFMASITHELKTPINAILGMSDLLKLTQLNNEQIDYLDIMETSTKFLQKLISDILDISKIETGHVVVQTQSFDLKKVLFEITRSFEYSLSKKNIPFKFDWKLKLQTHLIGDPLLLQQIIINLLSNAEKFTDIGAVKLVVEKINETNKQIKIRFTVEDTGVGISKEYENVIFEKFVQLPATKQHKSQGTGLGLSIVKSLLEIQNSTIRVSSSEGIVSSFTFDLDYKKGSEISEILNKIEISNRFEKVSFDEIKVLIVEDNILNQEYLKRLFRKWKVYHEIAGSGEEAIKKFSNTHFDCVMMDIQLPGIDGFESSIKLRTAFQHRSFFILAMTAVVFPNIEAEILKHGMNDIIKKPFTIDELYDKISTYFDTVKQNTISKQTLHFNPELDTDFLTPFYNNDLDYAIDVFEQFYTIYLKQFELLIQNINNTAMEDIKKQLHAIKPIFKMVGLTQVESMIEDFIKNNDIDCNTLSKMFVKKDIEKINSLIGSQIWDLKQAKIWKTKQYEKDQKVQILSEAQ
jgi:PAS domain S-box-containing protein